VGLVFELRASQLQRRCSTAWATPVHFALDILQIICPSWPWTTILLISASQVARITGVCHWCPATSYRLFVYVFIYAFLAWSFGVISQKSLPKPMSRILLFWALHFFAHFELIFVYVIRVQFHCLHVEVLVSQLMEKLSSLCSRQKLVDHICLDLFLFHRFKCFCTSTILLSLL
jgi:hypothetical protein